MRLPTALVSRRAAMSALAPLLTLALPKTPANAFSNALPSAANGQVERKARAPAPEGLGVTRNGGLRPCLDGKPHCFSANSLVGEQEVDTSKIGRDWIVAPWTYSGMTALGALSDLQKAVDAYPPGQAGIDAGGFKTTKVRIPETLDQPAYLYVQFEAAQGYVDDMEFLARPDGRVQVRTSSRVGYLDYGVNAKRFNWFAKKVGSFKGWQTTPIRLKEHLEYADLNELSSDKDLGL